MTADAVLTPELNPQDGSENGMSGSPFAPMLEPLVARLIVLAGNQQGSALSLPAGSMLSLGQSIDNDIVVRDSSVNPVHLMLRIESTTIHLDVLGADVQVDGARLATGGALSISATSLVQLGAVTLQLEPVGGCEPTTTGINDEKCVPGIQALLASSSDELSRNTESESIDVTQDTSTTYRTRALQRWSTGVPGKLSALASVSLLLGALALWQGDWLRRAPSTVPVPLKTLLASSPFPELSVQNNAGVTSLNGFLETLNDGARLDEWLSRHSVRIDNQVLIGESLENQVSEVFRVNGIHAVVRLADGGVANVVTRVADAAMLSRVKSEVLTDVPGVSAMKLENTPPEVPPEPRYTVTDPGKRVAMVVYDKPAHIVTEDQSRYFVGAILPNGHRIAAIEDGIVSLEFNGEISEMEF